MTDAAFRLPARITSWAEAPGAVSSAASPTRPEWAVRRGSMPGALAADSRPRGPRRTDRRGGWPGAPGGACDRRTKRQVGRQAVIDGDRRHGATEPGFPIWPWYSTVRTSRRALISGAPT